MCSYTCVLAVQNIHVCIWSYSTVLNPASPTKLLSRFFYSIGPCTKFNTIFTTFLEQQSIINITSSFPILCFNKHIHLWHHIIKNIWISTLGESFKIHGVSCLIIRVGYKILSFLLVVEMSNSRMASTLTQSAFVCPLPLFPQLLRLLLWHNLRGGDLGHPHGTLVDDQHERQGHPHRPEWQRLQQQDKTKYLYFITSQCHGAEAIRYSIKSSTRQTNSYSRLVSRETTNYFYIYSIFPV